MKLRLPSSEQLHCDFKRVNHIVVEQALPSKLVKRWRREAEHISEHARLIERKDAEFQLVYRVVTGDIIRERWPELFKVYSHRVLLDWIKDITGEPVFTSPHIQSAVNLNIMDGSESVYRWHFDAVPYTALLYLTDVRPEDGGALELIPDCQPHTIPDSREAERNQLWPTAGTLVLMDGTRCYHRVAPIVRPSLRLSIPLVYPHAVATYERPAGLDSYLYEPR